jgi:hypothetical protein
MNRKVPEFRSPAEERAYWAESGEGPGADACDERPLSSKGLKFSETAVSLRLPGAMLEELRVQSRLMDVEPRFLMKIYLVERIEREMMKERSG